MISPVQSPYAKWLPSTAVASSTPEKPKGSFDSAFKAGRTAPTSKALLCLSSTLMLYP